MLFVFFFQAEDGIRDWSVTGVQTCALPICAQVDSPTEAPLDSSAAAPVPEPSEAPEEAPTSDEIGRASCRERV